MLDYFYCVIYSTVEDKKQELHNILTELIKITANEFFPFAVIFLRYRLSVAVNQFSITSIFSSFSIFSITAEGMHMSIL